MPPVIIAVNRFARRAAVTTVTLVVAACARGASRPAPGGGQSVVLISLDGFRSEYLDRYQVPHLRALAARGVRARWMEPSFPVLTFPNHYTIVTGLVPAHHGIVGNNMVDATLGRFRMTDSNAVRESRWWGGEPVWVTAERQGMRTGSFFWPGSEAAIGGVRPTFYKSFDDSVPASIRVDTVLAWLTRPDAQRTRFATLYFGAVDHAGHDSTPTSAATEAAVLTVDSAVGRLVGALDALGLSAQVNVIVVSDHGMAETSRQRAVILDDYLDPASVTILSQGAMIMLSPKDNDTNRVVTALRRAPHLTVFAADATPERWRYRGNARIAGVIGVPDGGWMLTTRDWLRRNPDFQTGGAHGFEPADTSMHALFIAAGPAFRSGVTVAPFRNVHVYELLCAVLGLQPAPNDGAIDSVRVFLRRQARSTP